MRSQDGKIELQKKVHKRICISDITYLAAHCSSYVICHFCRFFHLLPPFCLLGKKMLCSKKFLAPENGVYGLQHSVSTALQKPEFMLVQVKNNNKKLKKRSMLTSLLSYGNTQYHKWCFKKDIFKIKSIC